MTKNVSFLRETIIYSIGSFGSKILSFLLVPLYTFYLTKVELGEYDLFLTTISLFIPIVSLQLSDAVYRWLIEFNKNEEINNFLSIVFTSSFLVLLSVYAIFSIAYLVYLSFYPMHNALIFIVLLLFSSILPYFQSLLRGLGRTKDFAFSGLITTIVMVVLNVMLVAFFHLSVKAILLVNIASFGISSIVIFIRLSLFKCFKFHLFDWKMIKEMLVYSIPLIPNLISWWLISSASKFIILDKLGLEANGIYAVANRFPSILVLINSVLILPIQDSFLKEGADFKQFADVVKKYVRFELVLVFLLSVGAPIYVSLLVQKSFYESWSYMPFLYLGVGFNTLAALISLVYQKEKKTIRITVTTLIGGGISIALSFFLINIYGLGGVSFSFFIGYFVMFILRLIDVQKKYDFDINFLKQSVWLIIFVSVICLQMYLDYYLQLLVFIISTLFLIGYFKSEILGIYNKVRNDRKTNN